ncbi:MULTISPECIES: hypothetical protein [unclassified Stenotrophomonas]|uniref:hypothetical protein n=1 Tax=unclassified Stenotrophomonas TaxID=196198 RepID=UPI0012FEDDC5|nr:MULTISPECIES: hypothetical protein [unclassified Stenotrophomonas]
MEQLDDRLPLDTPMHLVRTLMTLLLLVTAACQGPHEQPPMHEALRPYMHQPGAEPAGGNALAVYLSADDGRVLVGGARTGVPTTSRIRLLLRAGRIPDAYTRDEKDGRVTDEGDGFVRYFPPGDAFALGIVRFTGPDGRRVHARQSSGETPGEGNYLAEVQLDGIYLEYLYTARSQADHMRVAELASGWLMKAN